MEISGQTAGTHATASPCGRLVACVVDGKLRVCNAQAPERIIDFSIRIAGKDVNALKWSNDSGSIAVCSARQVEVNNLDDPGHTIRLDNGGGGFGRFSSADFVASDQLLTVWEFGRAKLWNLVDGKGIDIDDIKTTCDGTRWQMRPVAGSGVQTLAALSRTGAEDYLTLHFPNIGRSLPPVKLPTLDAQSVQWSPDGRWLTILDTPIAYPSLRIYTADGHLFRSFPLSGLVEGTDLGIKSVTWSSDSSELALSKYDGKVVFLSTQTFAKSTVFEHSTTISQNVLSPDQQAPIWSEILSASGDRSYSLQHQPVSPPLSRVSQSLDPSELGVAELSFSCDGSYLATRDERMLSTVWIWNMATVSLHTILIQHANVRRMQWHPSRPESLMLDCGESVAYLYDASTTNAPVPVAIQAHGTPTFSWLLSSAGTKSAILCANKSGFCVLYPEGRDSTMLIETQSPPPAEVDTSCEEGASEDSILDLLSGRKPLPPRTEPSYTELVDIETSADDQDASERLEDTFRGKQKTIATNLEVDPLDDSEIF